VCISRVRLEKEEEEEEEFFISPLGREDLLPRDARLSMEL